MLGRVFELESKPECIGIGILGRGVLRAGEGIMGYLAPGLAILSTYILPTALGLLQAQAPP